MVKMPLISNFLPKKNRFIGLDIGSSSVKLAEIANQQGKLVPLKLRLQQIDSLKDNHDAQLDALKILLRDINTKEAKINVVINCSLSCTKISVIPFMPKSEILQALKWEMKNYISFPIDQAILDYEILKEITDGGVKKLKVAVGCCPQETVNKYLDLLSAAGIGPSVFTQHCFALRNVITTLCSKENKTLAFLDIGYNFSELLIFRKKEPVFSRKLPVAGRDFTQKMTQSLVSELGKTELTLEEAESIKKKYGIPFSQDTELLDDKISRTQLISLLRPNLEKLITEIERSFAFYHEKEQGEPIERILLLGAGSSLKNLPENLSESLNVPVQIGDPLAVFQSNGSSVLNYEQETAHCFASALGAAMVSSHKINLLPIEIKQQTRLLIKRSSIKALVTTIVVVMILLYAGMNIRFGVYSKRVAAAELEIEVLSPQIEELPKRVFLGNIKNRCIIWSSVLKEISNLVPEEVYLIKMKVEENIITLNGEIKTPSLLREQVLTEFMCALEKGIFRNVVLISTKDLSEEKLCCFELRMAIE